jgi:hypothetical protein
LWITHGWRIGIVEITGLGIPSGLAGIEEIKEITAFGDTLLCLKGNTSSGGSSTRSHSKGEGSPSTDGYYLVSSGIGAQPGDHESGETGISGRHTGVRIGSEIGLAPTNDAGTQLRQPTDVILSPYYQYVNIQLIGITNSHGLENEIKTVIIAQGIDTLALGGKVSSGDEIGISEKGTHIHPNSKRIRQRSERVPEAIPQHGNTYSPQIGGNSGSAYTGTGNINNSQRQRALHNNPEATYQLLELWNPSAGGGKTGIEAGSDTPRCPRTLGINTH